MGDTLGKSKLTTERWSSLLTPIQEGMFAASSARPWLYVEQIVCHLDEEKLVPEAMGTAFDALLSQHPALRLVARSEGSGRPTQHVGRAHRVPLEICDWSAFSPTGQNEKLRDLLHKDRMKGCLSSTSPCFRLTLILTGPNSSKLIWTFPHILLDGRSFAPLLAQAFENYQTILAGRAPVLDPNQTADLFYRHSSQLAELDHSDGISHFTASLEGWAGGTELVDHSSKPARKHIVTHHLGEAETEALSSLAQKADVTFSTIVAAAWGIVSARFTDRADTVFGMTLNGRHLIDESGDAPGCFIVTVPLRIRISRDMTIGDVLRNLRQNQIALRPFEQTPLAKLRQVTDVPFDQPFLESTLMFETQTLDQQMKARGGAWDKRRVDLHEEDDVPVTVAAYQGAALAITVEYDPAQVPKGDQLALYLRNFLTNLATASPDPALADLSMLDDHETRQLEALSGGKLGPSKQNDCCLTRFELQAAHVPDRPALRQIGGENLSYCEVDRAANTLAHRLLGHGITSGDVVGICAARSPAFVVAMLAVWKVGAAFVPMDPKYPPETLEIMAQDGAAKIILTDASAPVLTGPTLSIIHDGPEPNLIPAPDRSEMAQDRLAYVLFTSGSTGRPKGVMVSHASLSAHAEAAIDLFGITPDDRALQFASLSFDVAIEEIVPTLLAGATLVLRSPQMSQSISEFLDRVMSAHITVLNLPTGFWVALTEALESDGSKLPQSVRLVIVGGERVPLSVLRRWRSAVPDVRWVNGYGPTETTITCTAYEALELDSDMQSVPIGTPLAHARAWVLAADGSLAPMGVQGELCISGPAVAEGYVDASAMGMGGFQRDNIGVVTGRSYRTGDRVFWKKGLLNFVGRIDRQIKLRGFRIDPVQIESLLEARDDIARAYVAAPSFGKAPKRLVAWYSGADTKASPSPQEVLADITQKLPFHMHPVLVQLEDWPQTPGGKIKVDQLPQPAELQQEPNGTSVEVTPRILEIISLFKDVLKTDSITADSSFFEVGGDSLSLLRLLSVIEKKFKVILPPMLLYKDPSPTGISRLLKAKVIDHLSIVPIQPEGDGRPLYAIHALGENNGFFRPLAKALGTGQPLFGISVGLRSKGMPQTVEEFGAFYCDQIMRHQPEGALSLAAVSASSFITFEVAQQLLRAGRDVKSLIFLDASGPDGRPRKSRMGHRWAHLKEFLRQGKPYLDKLREEHRGEQVHAEALARLAQSDPTQTEDNDALLSVADFVALSERAISTYAPASYPRKMTIFRADDPFDSAAVYASGLGWKSVAAKGFEIIDVKGGHITMLYAPHVTGLALRLREFL